MLLGGIIAALGLFVGVLGVESNRRIRISRPRRRSKFGGRNATNVLPENQPKPFKVRVDVICAALGAILMYIGVGMMFAAV